MEKQKKEAGIPTLFQPGLLKAEKRAKEQEIAVSNQITKKAGQLIIQDSVTYEKATEWLLVIKKKRKEIEEERKGMTKPIDESKKRIMAFFKPATDLLDHAERTLKPKLIKYQQEQRQIRAEKEMRLQEQARREQEKLERAAERKAQTHEKHGRIEEAQEIRENVPDIPPPIVESQIPEKKGISTMRIWKYEIENPDKVPDEYKIPDEVKIGKVVRATKGSVAIEGVRIYSEEVLAAGGTR